MVAGCELCFCCYLLVGFGGYLVCLMILVACGFGLCDCVLNGFGLVLDGGYVAVWVWLGGG